MSINNFEFRSLTVFVMATNETDSLCETILKIKENCSSSDLEKIIIVARSRDCLSYHTAKALISESTDDKIELYVQKSQDSVRCVYEFPFLVKSSHFVIMGADLEMDPNNIKDFVAGAKKKPEAIICASKWMKGSVVEGYGMFHEFGSRLMNNFVALLFNTKAKDIFSLYQMYPVCVYDKMKFSNQSTFVYEYTLKPLRMGIRYEEIPTVYKKRSEGKSTVNIPFMFKLAFEFCTTALRIRFTPKRYLNGEKTRSSRNSYGGNN